MPPRQTSPAAQVEAQPPELPPPDEAPPAPLLAPPVPTLAPPRPLAPPFPLLPPLPVPTLPPLPASVVELPPLPLTDCDAEFPQPTSIEIRTIAEAIAPARTPQCARSSIDGSRCALSLSRSLVLFMGGLRSHVVATPKMSVRRKKTIPRRRTTRANAQRLRV